MEADKRKNKREKKEGNKCKREINNKIEKLRNDNKTIWWLEYQEKKKEN